MCWISSDFIVGENMGALLDPSYSFYSVTFANAETFNVLEYSALLVFLYPAVDLSANM